MDITEFFQLSAGKWFSHRTSHHLGIKQTEGGKSDLRIEILSKSDPTVVQLCQQYEVDPALALCGSRTTWNGSTASDKARHAANSTVLVAIADPQKPNEGKLLREMGNATKAPGNGRYIIGADDALTLIVEDETTCSEERLWFASPNLRLRTSILKQFGGFSRASFCSEIRKGDTQQPETTTQSGSKAAP